MTNRPEPLKPCRCGGKAKELEGVGAFNSGIFRFFTACSKCLVQYGPCKSHSESNKGWNSIMSTPPLNVESPPKRYPVMGYGVNEIIETPAWKADALFNAGYNQAIDDYDRKIAEALRRQNETKDML